MTAPIGSFQGLASGIQWRDLVDQIMEIETARATGPVARNINAANQRIEGWTVLGTAVTKVRDALKALQDGSAFKARAASVSATASGRTLAGISNIATAAAGRYSVEVRNLAQAEKLSGLAVADPTDALGLTGRFSVNGVSISLEATDSLDLLRDKLNAANSGSGPSRVSASVVRSGGASRLVLNADTTGAAGIELADDRSGPGGTSTLEALGLVDGSRALNTGADGRVRSMRVSSTTLAAAAALGISVSPSPATVLVNGRALTVDLENDSITDIVARINALSPNAATVETETDGGATWSRVSVAGSIVGDGSAGADRVLEALGMRIGGRASNITQVVTAGTVLSGFGGANATGSTLLSDLGAGSAAGVQAGDLITLAGTDGAGASVTMSYTVTGTDTVNDLLGAIEGAFAGGRDVSASIVDGQLRFTDSSAGDSRLSLTLSAGLQGGGTLDFGGTSTTFGRVRRLAAGEDSQVVIDGATVTGRTNVLAGAIGGATLTLQGEEPGSAFDVTVTATPETSLSSVQALAASYNELLATVGAETRADGRLAFSTSARAVLGAFKGTLLNDMAGLGASARYLRAGDIGLELQRDGTLKLNTDKFKSALDSDPTGVSALFASGGSSSNGNVQFVGSESVTPSGVFALAVTRAASRASTVGGLMVSYVSSGTPATMTVTSESSGRSATITFTNGDTPAIIAARLQAALTDEAVGVNASVDGGALRLTAAEFGSSAGFTVSYGDPGAEDPATQLGLPAATYDNGLDAAGTLDGIALTGAGQLLTADNGVVVRYTGSAATATSSVRFARGLAGTLARSADTMLASGSGTIALQRDTAQNGIASLERRETDILSRLERRRATLIADFTRMETLLGRLQGQGQWLTSQIGSIQNISAARASGN